MSLRGFSDHNFALMVNGQPVNDMENGKVYWSSWSGLQDIATAVQVQRGLGASKLAVSSVGGGINIITKATDRKKGGFAQFGTGNDNYYKLSTFYSTGLDKNGWGASFLLTQRQGEGYIIGTPFNAYNYFFSLGYKPDTRHTFNLVFTGVSEWHGKRSRTIAIEDYLKYNHDRLNIRHNANWGYRNGQVFNWINNYYNKPIAQLNWNWKINLKLFLTSIVYASWGWGGGSNVNGKINGKDAYRLPAAEDGSQRIDDIEKWNKGGAVPDFGLSKGKWPGVTHNGEYITTKSEGIYQVASINKHSWYGFISNLGYKPDEQWAFDLGLDLRAYNSTRYQAIANLMGAQALYENSDINQPHRFITHTTPIKYFKNTPVKDRISYYNRANIRWAALFGQIEYTENRFSTFIQGALSNQAYKRTDPFRYPRHSALYETPRNNRWGGNLKGGFNININTRHNIFFNTGYYNRQPYFRALFPKNNQFYDNNMKNETVSSIEIGYGFQSEKLEMRLNAYHTLWANRFLSLTNQNFKLNEQTTITGTVDLKNIKQLHQGIELEMSYRPFSKLRINGQFSYGNWRYKDNVTASYFDETNRLVIEPISREPFTNSIPLKNHLIGGSAQLTGSLGFALYS